MGSSRTVARLELHNLRVPLPSHGYLCTHFRRGGRVCCLTWGGRLWGKRDVLQCRAQISDSDSWSPAQKFSSIEKGQGSGWGPL